MNYRWTRNSIDGDMDCLSEHDFLIAFVWRSAGKFHVRILGRQRSEEVPACDTEEEAMAVATALLSLEEP